MKIVKQIIKDQVSPAGGCEEEIVCEVEKKKLRFIPMSLFACLLVLIKRMTISVPDIWKLQRDWFMFKKIVELCFTGDHETA